MVGQQEFCDQGILCCREVFEPSVNTAGELAHHYVLMMKENNLFTVDVEWCVHILTERQYFSCIERAGMGEFFVVKEMFKKLVACCTKSQAVLLMEIVCCLVKFATKGHLDSMVITVFKLVLEPSRNLLRQDPLRFVRR